jgi:hypothetical protein
MRATIELQLVTKLDPTLVRELLDAHAEVRRNFHLGGLRLSAVEGGRFCEAAFRLLEQIATGKWTSLGKRLDTDKLIENLRNLGGSRFPDSMRLHIPRALRLVYDIRNNRDTAHLADGIDPNLQDATLVVSTVNWVLAEFVRQYHSVSADEAHRIVDDVVARTVPIIQDFGGQLKVLNTSLGARDYCLVLLYHRGSQGATYSELESWVRPPMRANLRRTLRRLEDDSAFVHSDGQILRITQAAERDVERRRLVEP